MTNGFWYLLYHNKLINPQNLVAESSFVQRKCFSPFKRVKILSCVVHMFIWLCDSILFSTLSLLFFNRSAEEVRVAYRVWYLNFEMPFIQASQQSKEENKKVKTIVRFILGIVIYFNFSQNAEFTIREFKIPWMLMWITIMKISRLNYFTTSYVHYTELWFCQWPLLLLCCF